jgi:methenyltetrahydrofolate cyclohydrolase
VAPEDAAVPFRDLTLGAFAARLGSADPVPGGGSASAAAGALGAELVAMVAALSIDRPKYAEHASLLAAARQSGLDLGDRLLRLADEDAVAYGGYAAARKLPRETEAEQATRTAALQRAARAASTVPLEVVAACRDLVAAAESLAGRSNPNASSDLAVAALLGEAAARGAAANVHINLPSIGDEELAATLSARVDGLVAEVAILAAETRAVVAAGVARPPVDASATE